MPRVGSGGADRRGSARERAAASWKSSIHGLLAVRGAILPVIRCYRGSAPSFSDATSSAFSGGTGVDIAVIVELEIDHHGDLLIRPRRSRGPCVDRPHAPVVGSLGGANGKAQERVGSAASEISSGSRRQSCPRSDATSVQHQVVLMQRVRYSREAQPRRQVESYLAMISPAVAMLRSRSSW
jgi:hypothetical protein